MFESLSKLWGGCNFICKEFYLAKLITSPCNVHTDNHYSSCTREECNAIVHTNKMHIHLQVTISSALFCSGQQLRKVWLVLKVIIKAFHIF